MLIWWENLQARDRLAVAASALAVILLAIYLLLHPLLANRTRLQEEVNNHRAELAWMREAAQEIGQSGVTADRGGATPPLQFIDQAARENHLSDQLKRMEPGTDGEIKVWLNNAAYVDLVHWLRQLTANGRLTLTNLSVEKSSAPGLVSAQLTLDSGGSKR